MNGKYINLTLTQSVAIYCLAGQFYSSVARTFEGQWDELAEYYTAKRIEFLQRHLDDISSLLTAHGVRSRCDSSEQFNKRLTKPYAIREIRNFCSSICNHNYKFLPDELEFIVSVFESVVGWLNSEDGPPYNEQLKLRDDVSYVAALVRFRCPRIYRIPKSEVVENAFQPSFITHYRIEDILREV